MIKCNLCNKEFEQLSCSHLKQIHGMTTGGYKILFPGAPFFSEEQKNIRRVSRPNPDKGKTYEERYGVEKAAKLREFHRNFKTSTGPCYKFTICKYCGKEINDKGMGLHRLMHEREDLLPKDIKVCLMCNKEFNANTVHRVTPVCNLCWDSIGISEQNNLSRRWVCSLPGMKEKMSEVKKKSLIDNPESHPNRILAGSGRSKTNPSYPQMVLHNIVSEKYLADINYPVNTGKTVRYLDVAIVDKKFDFEYDGEYFHDSKKDEIRDKELNNIGWIVYHVRGWNEIDFVRDNLDKIMKGGESQGVDAMSLVASRVKV